MLSFSSKDDVEKRKRERETVVVGFLVRARVFRYASLFCLDAFFGAFFFFLKTSRPFFLI